MAYFILIKYVDIYYINDWYIYLIGKYKRTLKHNNYTFQEIFNETHTIWSSHPMGRSRSCIERQIHNPHYILRTFLWVSALSPLAGSLYLALFCLLWLRTNIYSILDDDSESSRCWWPISSQNIPRVRQAKMRSNESGQLHQQRWRIAFPIYIYTYIPVDQPLNI